MTGKLPITVIGAALAGAAAWLSWPQGGSAPGDSPASGAIVRAAKPVLLSGPPVASAWESPAVPAAGDGDRALARATPDDWRDPVIRASLNAGICQLAEGHPDEAIALLERIPVEVRDAVQLDVAAALIGSRPMDAVKLLDALPPSETTSQMLRQAAMECAVRDLPGTLAWARAQTDPDIRAAFLSAVLCVQAETDPRTAAASVDEVPDGPLRRRVAAEIARRWEAVDAAAAAEFRRTLPDNSDSGRPVPR